MDIHTAAKLNNGVAMPLLGLGMWKVPSGKAAEQAVLWALEAGYRHVDTAAIYMNEQDVGNAILKSKVPRSELFVTTKLWNADHKDPAKALTTSLKKLQMDYVDLYLIHWPVEGKRNKSWKELEKLLKQGKCRAIGVSNFTIRHLQELLASPGTVPAVNQVEFNPYLFQKELWEFCKSKKIQLEAYSPLTHAHKLKDSKLAAIASNYSKTPAQVLIRWELQHGIVVIPKSAHRERIIENADVFDFAISSGDMKKLDGFNENLRTCWDPTNVP